MKNIVGLIAVGVAVFALSGCAGDGSGDEGMDTHFLTNLDGVGIEGVPYDCSVGGAGTTGVDGSYGFESGGDNCTFMFDQHATDEPLYIRRSEFGAGVSGLHYRCTYSTGSAETPYRGVTDSNGHIKHVWYDGEPVEDRCTLEY